MSVKEIKQWFELAVPNPTKDNQRVQLGVHFEEVAEMFDGITETTTSDSSNRTKLTATAQSLRILSDSMKKDKDFALKVNNRDSLLDSLCDQIVTAIGTAHVNGFDILGALAEVSRSNNSKFVDGKPVFNENGKIAKGPNYSKPDLSPFIGFDPVNTTSC